MLAASVARAGGAGLGIARTRGEAAVALPRHRGAGLSVSAANAAIWRAAKPSCRRSALLELPEARRSGEDHALADARGEGWRVMTGKASRGAVPDEGTLQGVPEGNVREQR